MPRVVGPAEEALVEYARVVVVASELVLNHFKVFPQICVLAECFLDGVSVDHVEDGCADGLDAVGGSFVEEELEVTQEGVGTLNMMYLTLI